MGWWVAGSISTLGYGSGIRGRGTGGTDLAAAGQRDAPAGRYASRLVSLGDVREGGVGDLVDRLRRVPGVIEAVVVADEGVAYLKVDRASGRSGWMKSLARPA